MNGRHTACLHINFRLFKNRTCFSLTPDIGIHCGEKCPIYFIGTWKSDNRTNKMKWRYFQVPEQLDFIEVIMDLSSDRNLNALSNLAHAVSWQVEPALLSHHSWRNINKIHRWAENHIINSSNNTLPWLLPKHQIRKVREHQERERNATS